MLKELNKIYPTNSGIYKLELLKNKKNEFKLEAFVRKIGFSIDDLNHMISKLNQPEKQDIVYVISLVDWITDGYDKVLKCYFKDIIDSYTYDKQKELDKCESYFKAVRSFITAHPLGTHRHKNYGLKGEFIGVDIKLKTDNLVRLFPENHFYYIDLNKMHDGKHENDDFYMRSYCTKQGSEAFVFIGCSFKDLYHVAEVYIDAFNDLDMYLTGIYR